jgi:hypothetical protein
MTLSTPLAELRARKKTSDMIPIFHPPIGKRIGEFADGGAATIVQAVALHRQAERSLFRCTCGSQRLHHVRPQ